MSGRFRVRPSKASSAMQLPIAVAFVIFGVFWVIPNSPASWPIALFGVLWTLLAVAAVAYHAANLLGMSIPGVLSVESETDPGTPTGSISTPRCASSRGCGPMA